MAEGCNEKMDLNFILWILFFGRRKAIRERFRAVRDKYPDKTVILKNQKQLDDYEKRLEQ